MPYQTKQRTRNGVVQRQCHGCDGWFPLVGLAKARGCTDGRRPMCWACQRIERRGHASIAGDNGWVRWRERERQTG